MDEESGCKSEEKSARICRGCKADCKPLIWSVLDRQQGDLRRKSSAEKIGGSLEL
jgi:hypothetical protein